MYPSSTQYQRRPERDYASPYRWDIVDKWEVSLRNKAEAHFLKARQNGQLDSQN